MDSYYSILRIILKHFRNYQYLCLDIDRRSVVLTGANGAGKTNLLEALSYLRLGRGLRGSPAEELRCQTDCQNDNHSMEEWGLSVHLQEQSRMMERAVAWRKDKNNQWRASRRIEGALSKKDLLLPILWLSPGADRHSAANRTTRRDFIDQLISAFDDQHSLHLSHYDKFMRERSRLLRSDGYQGESVSRWLSSLERKLAEKAVIIASARKIFIDGVNAVLVADFFDIGLKPQIRIEGVIEGGLENQSALSIEEYFVGILLKMRQQDSLSGGCGEGVHRSIFTIFDDERGMDASLCSTGQQKMLTLSLLLAAASMLGRKRDGMPILLLDEVAAHLDAKNASIFFDKLLSLKCQAWMSGISRDLFATLGNKIQGFNVSKGQIAPWSNQ